MITQIFNSYLTAKLVMMANDMGLLKALEQQGSITTQEMLSRFNFRQPAAQDLLRFLTSQQVLREEEGHYSLSDTFSREYRQNYGMLYWLLGGYGNVIDESHAILTGDKRYGKDILRDSRKMAEATSLISAQNTDQYMYELLHRLDFSLAVDLGCGSGLRLLQLAEHYPTVRLSGIDISEECCALARQNIAQNNKSAQINIVCSSAEDWSENIAETRTDAGRNLILCFGMFHDLLNIPGCAERMLQSIRHDYPAGTYLLIQDQMRAPVTRVTTDDWVEGFSFVHRLMGQSLYSLDVYTKMMQEHGFSVKEVLPTLIPENYLLLAELG